MNSISALSNEDLHEKTRAAAAREKQATLELLDFLAEIDARRLYAERGYSTLWEYVHRALGYSESQSSERVASMRLMRKVPEVREELRANRVSLTSVSKLAVFVRREKCGPEKTRSLLEKISERPTREAERILLAEQAMPHARPDRVQAVGESRARVSFDADSEFLALYEEWKNRRGRVGENLGESLKAALRVAVESKRPKESKRAEASNSPSLRAPEVKEHEGRDGDDEREGRSSAESFPKEGSVSMGPSRSRYIPVADRAAIRTRSGDRCEYVDPSTDRRCEGRFGLQFDHIRPFAKGGPSTRENLRQLCANHNRLAAVREFGKTANPAMKKGERIAPSP